LKENYYIVFKELIRKDILEMKHPTNTKIKHTGNCHFDNIVYSHKQNIKEELNSDTKFLNEIEEYNEILLNSRYSLCPSGTGQNSIRLWESLATCSIPILLSDNLELPKHHLWNESIIIIKEKDILNNISIEKENEIKRSCLFLYKLFISFCCF
jgi:hypothetical protein